MKKSTTLAIAALCFASLAQVGCATDTFFPSYSGFGQTDDYGQSPPYRYADPYAFQPPYASPWMGRRPYWNAPQSRVFSPDPGMVCDQRKAVCYKWHNGSREWRPDRSDTRDNFGKKAARRLNR
jgi:hypothetical protein